MTPERSAASHRSGSRPPWPRSALRPAPSRRSCRSSRPPAAAACGLPPDPPAHPDCTARRRPGW
eukprot:5664547-Prymnesium_polylepis.1